MESFVILAIAAGLSAAVVWWAVNQPGDRPKPKEPRVTAAAPVPQSVSSLEELSSDGFVLLPIDAPAPPDDRPSPALSIVRLVLTITFFAALGVGVLAALGYLLKTQLDQYFTGL